VRMGAIVFALIVVGLVLVVSHKRRQSIRSERP
jgi:hypothetical protein